MATKEKSSFWVKEISWNRLEQSLIVPNSLDAGRMVLAAPAFWLASRESEK